MSVTPLVILVIRARLYNCFCLQEYIVRKTEFVLYVKILVAEFL